MIRAFEGPGEPAEPPLHDPAELCQLPTAVTREADGHCSVVHALCVCSGHVCSAGGDAMIRMWKEENLEYVG